MRQIIVILVFLLFLATSYGQQYARTEQVYSGKTNFEFTNEWAYVSTDLYLFNSNKFNGLLNKINPDKRKRRRNKEVIKNILVTAQLSGLEDLDALTYPIFNFVVSKDDKGNLKAEVSETEVVRLVDNIPVSTLSDHIGAKISVKIYSDKNRSEIYKFVAAQMQNASSFSGISAKDAALKAIGELGKLMQNDAAGKQYQFESTIRFYEEQNFDRQLHSVSVFVFKPSTNLQIGFDTINIAEFLSTSRQIPTLPKVKIKELINFNLYPYIIAVNYKSKYKPKISDEITSELVEQRNVENESNYSSKLISRDIYHQEKSLIDFLRIFAQLQLNINSYELNYNSKITEDYTIQLFIILQNLWELKNSKLATDKQYSGNPLYENEFKALYNRYLTQANLKFEFNSSLRSVREHLETILTLEKSGISGLDSAQIEDFLRKLKSVKIPPRELKSDESITSQRWIALLDNEQYTKNFEPKIKTLNKKAINERTYNELQQLKLQSATSYCELCKQKVQSFDKDFMIRYNKFMLSEARKKYQLIYDQTQMNILKFARKYDCIKSKLDTVEKSGKSLSNHQKLILKTLGDVNNHQEFLFNLFGKDSKLLSNHDQISAYISKIEQVTSSVEVSLASICDSAPEFCDCDETGKQSARE